MNNRCPTQCSQDGFRVLSNDGPLSDVVQWTLRQAQGRLLGTALRVQTSLVSTEEKRTFCSLPTW